jgi:hypothetical protein
VEQDGIERDAWSGDRWLKIVVVSVAAVLTLTYNLLPAGSDRASGRSGTRILLEAEDALGIGASVRVREEEERRGSRYLHFPPRKSLLDPVALEEEPTLRFELEADGDYWIWARTRWKHVCANSFLFRIDDGGPLLVGNEEEFGTWHWVRHPSPVALTAGEHRLAITTVEPDIEIDRLLVTDVADPVLPGEDWAGFADDLREGGWEGWEAGSAWLAPDRGRGARLPARREPGLQLALRREPRLAGDRWLYVRAGDPDTGDLVLVPGGDRYVRLGGDGVHAGSLNEPTAERRLAEPVDALLAPALGPVEWNVDLILEGGTLRVWQQGTLLVETRWEPGSAGRVGVGSTRGGLEVTEVRARTLDAPRLREGFYSAPDVLTRIRGFETVSGVWRRGYLYTAPITYPLESRVGTGRALIAGGERWWTRFRFSSAVRLKDDVWAGLLFRYHGPDDYAWLRARGAPDGDGRVELVERRRGVDRVVAGATVDLPRHRWRVLEVEVEDGSVRGRLDGRVVLEHAASPAPGRIGLATDAVDVLVPQGLRPPVLLLDKETRDPFYFGLSLELNHDDPGAILVFDYRSPDTFGWYGLVRPGTGAAALIVTERVHEGRKETLQRVRADVSEASRSFVDRNALWLPLAVRAEGDELSVEYDGRPVGRFPGQPVGGGRVGVQALLPPSHADFDELVVTPIGEPGPDRQRRLHRFSPAQAAARDFAEWSASAGEWDIGIIAENGLIYSLLGRTDGAGRATFRQRFPLEAPASALRLWVRPRLHGESEVRIALADPDAESADALTLRLALGPPETGGAVAVATSLEIDGTEVARAEPGTWSEPEWHEVALVFPDTGGVRVSIDGTTALDTPVPVRSRGTVPSLRISGQPGTVFGFREILVEGAP